MVLLYRAVVGIAKIMQAKHSGRIFKPILSVVEYITEDWTCSQVLDRRVGTDGPDAGFRRIYETEDFHRIGRHNPPPTVKSSFCSILIAFFSAP